MKQPNPVDYLMVVGPCPLYSPFMPCCLAILIIASKDPVYTLSACPFWIWILILVCSTGHFISRNVPQRRMLKVLCQKQQELCLEVREVRVVMVFRYEWQEFSWNFSRYQILLIPWFPLRVKESVILSQIARTFEEGKWTFVLDDLLQAVSNARVLRILSWLCL